MFIVFLLCLCSFVLVEKYTNNDDLFHLAAMFEEKSQQRHSNASIVTAILHHY